MNGKEITVIRFRDRSTTCASCRAACTHAVMVSGKIFATACPRHLALWQRRAAA